jgi:hypothetical protein
VARLTFVRLFADLLDDKAHPARVIALIADAAAPRTRAATPARTAGPDGLGEFEECTVDALPCWCLEDEHPGVACAAAIDPTRSPTMATAVGSSSSSLASTSRPVAMTAP